MANVYQMVTDRIIEELQQGVIPWEKPWTGVRDGAFNRISKKPYSIINQMLLRHRGEYASYKQWKEVGGQVRKGEKSEIVVFWKIYGKEEENEDGEVEIKNRAVLRYYPVFHISQVDGVEPLKEEELHDTEPIPDADDLLKAYVQREGITLEFEKSDKAYYRPATDTIHVPLLEQFTEVSEAYSTYFHEAVHSTGHDKRLARFEAGAGAAAFGSESYSNEELVAEIGSAMICNMLGVETRHSFRNTAAYIQSWLKVLQNDSRFVVSAASRAEKAVKFINGEQS
jgi:antirestriction protein ArdC